MVRRILLIGPESSGKTTLAKHLAAWYGTEWVPEYGRIYDESMRKPGPWTSDEFYKVARMQAWTEDRAVHSARRFLFCDTDIWTTSIFYELYLGERAPDLEAMARVHHYDTTFLLASPGFVPDGFRRPEAQQWMDDRLRATHKDFVELTGTIEERSLRARSVLEEALVPA